MPPSLQLLRRRDLALATGVGRAGVCRSQPPAFATGVGRAGACRIQPPAFATGVARAGACHIQPPAFATGGPRPFPFRIQQLALATATEFLRACRLPHLALAAALGLLAACQTSTPSAPSSGPVATSPGAPPSPAAPASAPPARPSLVEEQRRLAALFLGTPVVFTMQSSSAMRVEVPLRFCFDRGQGTVKPALAAVLDRIAQSQREGTSRIEIATPADAPPKPRPAASGAKAKPAAPSALAGRRSAAIRDRLVPQGVAADRIAVIDPDTGGVRLFVKESPAP